MNYYMSFLLTFISGFSTFLGIIPIFFKIKNLDKFISYTLSFSSGIILSISIFDLLFESLKMFNNNYSLIVSVLIFMSVFITGFLLSIVINKKVNNTNSLYKTGLVTFIGIIIHNIPEGILTFTASNYNINIGLSITLSIIMHNIPEGIAISVPVYYSTKSKLKVVFILLLSALSEPFGALLSYLFLSKFISDLFLGIIISLVCGIMIYISIFELYKEASKYKNLLLIKLFFLLGFIIMLLILKI